jgi:type I restriction-modification system DNA methylase subunit
MEYVGISNQNEYYTNHYFSTIFEENQKDCISKWREACKNTETKTPWASLRDISKDYYVIHNRFVTSRFDIQTLINIKLLADQYLTALGYTDKNTSVSVKINDEFSVPVYHEIKKPNGAPLLWIILATSPDKEESILEKKCFDGTKINELELSSTSSVPEDFLTELTNEELATKILFAQEEPPRFLIIIGMNQIALIDRNKWNEKRYLQFELEDIFSRREEQTLQAMAVLLHKENLCPDDGKALLDTFDEESQRNASGVSQDLKYALRESIELLGNEVIYDMKTRQNCHSELDSESQTLKQVQGDNFAGELTIQCLRYMYRMLFVLFIESRQELGYAPMKSQAYFSAYSLESLRDIADTIRGDIDNVGEGYYLHDTLAKLYDLIYTGYPKTDEELKELSEKESVHDVFSIPALKAHIFDPEYTKLITQAKIRNSVMLKIVDLMSITRGNGGRNSRRGRISYANLGINQMGAVYEALLSYRGFIADTDLYEVKRKGDTFNELDVGYFVSESQLSQYDEDERVRENDRDPTSKLRMYKKGTFIYRLAGREREKSASYYTPECLTKCLVKYALKELLKDKTADDILNLTVCEPAMGSAAFLNEAINQLAEAYLDKKQKELGESIPAEKRLGELQKVKMYLADRNVYGIDLNPIAVELAEVSLWLNTIYEGGFVPWFGTQLINGNSLIGARRQCYSVKQLKSKEKGLRWYENAPERVPLGTERKKDQRSNTYTEQIYHFLLGDPGMCDYTDKVIKDLEPANIKKMKDWKTKFTKEYTGDDIESLKRLSNVIDSLWNKQVQLRKSLESATRDVINIYGHQDTAKDSHTSIRQKDAILSKMYKTEEMQNAGPYARLKFAMDYWCSLWFWPIEKADLLPSRSEFLFDMSLILEGNVTNIAGSQPSLFEEYRTDTEKAADALRDVYKEYGTVDIPALCRENPRLALSKQIAEEQHFMHWELEFADVFAERGGFDFVIGNPPWIKLEWQEQGVLSDTNPMFAVKKLSATETARLRKDELENLTIRRIYFTEHESVAGQQSFLGATENYSYLDGAVNLYKCFLPQAWEFTNSAGISAFVHPESVYDDPKGGALRRILLKRLRKHFMFANELKLFAEVHHHTTFSLNVYGGPLTAPRFDTISNLYSPSTIEECYNGDASLPVPLVKNKKGEWDLTGHPDRIINITDKELSIFAKLFDGGCNYEEARLPVIHAEQLINVLKCFSLQERTLGNLDENEVFTTECWNETGAQKNGIIKAKVCFPDSQNELIYSGAHIGVSNPYFQTTRSNYRVNSDYDCLDLNFISDDYMIRVKYKPACPIEKYNQQLPETPWGKKVTQDYRILNREMVGCGSERTLTCAIAACGVAHVHTVFSVSVKNRVDMLCLAGCEASLPYDFFVKVLGKSHVNYSTNMMFPLLEGEKYPEIILRSLLLNCLTKYYSDLWQSSFNQDFTKFSWAKNDNRLNPGRFTSLTKEWNWNTPLRTDYERREALIELDVLVAMALGMTLDQLKTIYRIQFPVLQQYEADTWYDANGRITFTNNRSMVGVGFTRAEFENGIKDAAAGQVFKRTITDDTQPGGPVERTIEYVAPFDKCDREKDYETAWKFFEEKYGKVGE